MKFNHRVALLPAILILFIIILPYIFLYQSSCCKLHCWSNSKRTILDRFILPSIYEQSSKRNISNVTDSKDKKNDSLTVTEVNKMDKFELRKRQMMYKIRLRKAQVLHQDIEAIYDEASTVEGDNETKISNYYSLSKKIINPLDSKFLLGNEMICVQVPILFVLVPSFPGHRDIRIAIRSTYGSYSRDTHAHAPIMKMAFFIGRSVNKSLDQDVQKEYDNYKDIVFIDFVDSYFNLTLKILHGFKWIHENCKGVKYILKADEDVFVNINLLLAELESYHQYETGSVYGTVLQGTNLKVLKYGKWGVSPQEYPLSRYPPYVQGTSYTLTANLLPKILDISQQLPYLHIEDAFITGIIAGQILGAKLEKIHGNSNWGDSVPEPCRFVKTERISQTKMTANLMYETWKAFKTPETLCSNTNYTVIAHRSSYRFNH